MLKLKCKNFCKLRIFARTFPKCTPQPLDPQGQKMAAVGIPNDPFGGLRPEWMFENVVYPSRVGIPNDPFGGLRRTRVRCLLERLGVGIPNDPFGGLRQCDEDCLEKLSHGLSEFRMTPSGD